MAGSKMQLSCEHQLSAVPPPPPYTNCLAFEIPVIESTLLYTALWMMSSDKLNHNGFKVCPNLQFGHPGKPTSVIINLSLTWQSNSPALLPAISKEKCLFFFFGYFKQNNLRSIFRLICVYIVIIWLHYCWFKCSSEVGGQRLSYKSRFFADGLLLLPYMYISVICSCRYAFLTS